eukprot:COSAG03_NODE_2139_length_3085_cov_4.380107_3_plen_75_part_00
MKWFQAANAYMYGIKSSGNSSYMPVEPCMSGTRWPMDTGAWVVARRRAGRGVREEGAKRGRHGRAQASAKARCL